MWELDCEESWVPKNWCFWTVVLEKTLESPLDCKEIHPVHPKGDQSWLFIGRTDAEAETPIVWPPDGKSWLIGKDPDAGKDWGQEEKRTTEDEMVGWHHQLDGHEFGWTLGVGDGQGGLVCCSPWARKESDTSEWLSWTEIKTSVGTLEISIALYLVNLPEILHRNVFWLPVAMPSLSYFLYHHQHPQPIGILSLLLKLWPVDNSVQHVEQSRPPLRPSTSEVWQHSQTMHMLSISWETPLTKPNPSASEGPWTSRSRLLRKSAVP